MMNIKIANSFPAKSPAGRMVIMAGKKRDNSSQCLSCNDKLDCIVGNFQCTGSFYVFDSSEKWVPLSNKVQFF